MPNRRPNFDARCRAIKISERLLLSRGLDIREVELIVKKSGLFAFVCYTQYIAGEQSYYIVVSHNSYDHIEPGQPMPVMVDDYLMGRILPG